MSGAGLAGDQSGDRGEHRLQVLASAEVPGQGSPVLQVADAVLHADPLRRMSPAFGLVRRGNGEEDRDLVLPPGRPRGEDRTAGLGAEPLIPGVGQQGDAGNERQQLHQAGTKGCVISARGPGTVSIPSMDLSNSTARLSMMARGSNDECAITPWMRQI